MTEVVTGVGAATTITLADLPLKSHTRVFFEADLIGDQTYTEAYLTVSAERYRLLHTHRWDEDVIERLQADKRRRGRRRA